MREIRNLLIGLEINRDESQICYFDRKQQDPVSVTTKVGTNLYLFPTELSVLPDGEWHYGLEADYFVREKKAFPVPDFFRCAEEGRNLTIGTKRYEASELMRHFLEGALGLLGLSDVVHSTLGICVTTGKLTGKLADTFRKALLEIGFGENQILLTDCRESFYYYCYSQRPSVWTRNMGLIRFHGRDVKFYTMSELPEAKPHPVTIRYTGAITLPEDADERDVRFSSFVRKCCMGQLFSSIFITGEGFEKEWARTSIRTLTECARHVFEGNNLFVKGACWAAVENFERHQMQDRLYLGDDVVRTNLTIDVIDEGTQKVLTLVEAGRNWFDNGRTIDIIPDGRKDLVLTLTPLSGSTHQNIRIAFDGMPERPNRTTRIHLSCRCTSVNRCLVTAEDLGFGEFFPATHRKWQKEISLNEGAKL